MFTEGQEILEKRYKVIKKLGGGAFGEIFKGKFILYFLVKPLIPCLYHSPYLSLFENKELQFLILALITSLVIIKLLDMPISPPLFFKPGEYGFRLWRSSV